MQGVALRASTYGLVLMLCAAAAASAEEPSPKPPKPAPWAGSSLNYSNTISALSLDPSAEPDYNPYYAMTVGLAPRWKWHRFVYTAMSFSLSREITEADNQTREGEVWPSDLKCVTGVPPGALVIGGLKVSPKLTLIAPTGPVSQAQSLYVGITPGVTLSKGFKVLSGLNIGYGGSARFNVHEFTTAGRDAPTIPDCRGIECAELVNTGVRNASIQQSHVINIGLAMTRKWSVGTSVGLYLSHLYDDADVDGVSFTPIAGTDTRYALSYGLELGWKAMRGIGLGLGAATFNPQRAPNADYYRPYFNRYTQIYLDLRIGFEAFMPAKDKG